MAKVTAKGMIVKEVLERFPDHPSKALAEKILIDNPLLFDSVEDARLFVRYYRGACGAKHRKSLATKQFINDGKKFLSPESKAPKRKPFILPAGCDNILWMSDIHFPNHDATALELAVNYGIAQSVNCIVIGGDLLDNEPFSHWEKKPSSNKVREWFDMAYEFLLHLRLTFPEAKIYWLCGNHEYWYEKWLIKHAPIVFDDPYYKLESRMKLNDLDIAYIDQYTKVKAGKLFLLHGHTLIKGVFSPVNAARGLFLRAKASTLIGHVHSSSKHSETNLKEELIGCWSVGALCTLSPDYDPHNTKHNQGFAVITTQPNGDFHVDNKEIYNNRIL